MTSKNSHFLGYTRSPSISQAPPLYATRVLEINPGGVSPANCPGEATKKAGMNDDL